ncbi:MAG TPA: VIT1/CCC1 transporter family protein [Mesorhizobium sp.]|nr:VIT1/CCC1 transporter family protein [Mesorhizobium sp.]
MTNNRERASLGWLDPIDRISEILFGLIMVLTSTGTLSVITAGRAEVKTMILGALGCNLAWGIIDAGLYLMSCLGERGGNLLKLRTVRQTSDPDAGRRTLADALPAPLVSVLSRDELESLRQRLTKLPESPKRPGLTKDEWLGALGICVLVVLSTIPVIIPFLFIDELRPALRVSNAIAIAMLFMCGYVFARTAGLRPWPTGLVMVAIGAVMVGIAIVLGG